MSDVVRPARLRGALTDRSVGTKVLLAVLLASLVAAVVGVVGIRSGSSISAGAHRLYTQGAVPLDALATARGANDKMRQRVLLHLAGPAADKPRREKEIAEFDTVFDERSTAFGEDDRGPRGARRVPRRRQGVPHLPRHGDPAEQPGGHR